MEGGKWIDEEDNCRELWLVSSDPFVWLKNLIQNAAVCFLFLWTLFVLQFDCEILE